MGQKGGESSVSRERENRENWGPRDGGREESSSQSFGLGCYTAQSVIKKTCFHRH